MRNIIKAVTAPRIIWFAVCQVLVFVATAITYGFLSQVTVVILWMALLSLTFITLDEKHRTERDSLERELTTAETRMAELEHAESQLNNLNDLITHQLKHTNANGTHPARKVS